MRDMLAVAGVILLALGLGGTAAYLSVDLTPPGLELIRPPKPAVAERIKREEKQRTVQAEASGCKYCSSVADLAKTFSRRAEAARTHASALRAALPQVSDETSQAAGRELELKAANASAAQADAAAAVLTSWANRCVKGDMCKAPRVRTASAACASSGDPRSSAAVLIALTVRNAAQTCANGSCPSIDCTASAGLQSDMRHIEGALDGIGGRASVGVGQGDPAQLPVGPSTLKAELKRVADEAGYVMKMMPLLLDDSKAKLVGDKKLPTLAPEMVDARAVSVAQLSEVMEQAAAVSDHSESDPRREASWRLKSLATHMATLGREAQNLSGADVAANWTRAADSLGAALLDLARLQAMLDRVSEAEKAGASCDGSVAAAAQQLREASAMLDLCRMRSACIGRGGAASTVTASTGDLNATFERAKTTADALVVNDIGAETLLQVADDGAQPRAIDVLRAHGVCRRAGDLREASVAAPAVAQTVAQEVVAPAMTPTFVGAMAPQDVIANAVQTAIDAPTAAPEASADIAEPAAPLIQASVPVAQPLKPRAEAKAIAEAKPIAEVKAIAEVKPAAGLNPAAEVKPTAEVKPRRKPRLPVVSPVANDIMKGSTEPATDLDAPYRAVVLPQAGGPGAAFGGEGGPVQLKAPPTDAPAGQ